MTLPYGSRKECESGNHNMDNEHFTQIISFLMCVSGSRFPKPITDVLCIDFAHIDPICGMYSEVVTD